MFYCPTCRTTWPSDRVLPRVYESVKSAVCGKCRGFLVRVLTLNR